MFFDEFLGQKRTVNFLKRMVAGARLRGEAFPHARFAGPAGTGKTTLVRCLAKQFGTRLHIVLGGPQITDVQFANSVRDVAAHDFIFVDEAHSLRRSVQEMLYRAMDAQELPQVDADGNKKPVRVTSYRNVGPLCVILATNQPGGLLDALESRAGLEIPFERYSVEDLILIGRQCATHHKLDVTTQAMRLMACFSDGIPRNLKLRLHHLALYHANVSDNEITVEHVRELLEAQGINDDGLSIIDRRYLETVANGPASGTFLRTLTTAIGIDARQITNRLEYRYITNGWIMINGLGRTLTAAGKELIHINTIAKELP